MVYIRTKTVKGIDYLYLVKSVWDKKRKTSKQEIIKYLGVASNVTKNDIPDEFQNDSKVNSYLIRNLPENNKKRMDMENKLRDEFFIALTKGDKNKASYIFEQFTTTNELGQFYRKIFIPAMTKIGDLWETKKLGVAEEHVASNVAQNLIKNISEKNKIDGRKGRILLTTPPGESHSIGCSVLESFLQNKGFIVFNLAPSTPAQHLVDFMKTAKPDSVVVSITLEENIKSGQCLITKIREKSKKIPIYVGGQALQNNTKVKFNAEIVEDFSNFNTVVKLLKVRK